ncbi:MAG: TIGR03936 family radical SAM-associated protein [Oscillospiraceae bacterium]|nr:TIGR03936 family radical SAM-associated protein [Oscillospiraceae bacterium]
MAKMRLLFAKDGAAMYISHLDLMRTFQRLFLRGGMFVKHTQGFHPHPIMSIVLPLPVGQSSVCELLDFEITEDMDYDKMPDMLNAGAPDGLRVIKAYETSRPVRELAFVDAEAVMEYDGGVPDGAADAIRGLFSRESVVVQKKTKHREMADVDLIPMIRSLDLSAGDGVITARIVAAAQNPGMNPALIEKAIDAYLPEFKPDFTRVLRLEVLDVEGKVFR